MKTARVHTSAALFPVLANNGFDVDKPFKVFDRVTEGGEEFFHCIQYEDSDKEESQEATTCDQNGSGVVPVEYKVLISRPEMELRTDGGIHIPDAVVEKERMRRVFGILVAKGGNAFEDWKDPVPKVGQMVRIAKYVGEFFQGADGKPYQMISDKDISSIVTTEFKEEYYPTGQADFGGDGEFSHLRTQETPEEIYKKALEKEPPGQERIKVFMGGKQ